MYQFYTWYQSQVVYAKIYAEVDDYGDVKNQGGNSEYELSDVVKIQLHGMVNEDAGLHGKGVWEAVKPSDPVVNVEKLMDG